ncbi:MAG: hypothetical protein ACRBB3_01450 [Alphaproteobacteria bacterium]
MSIISSFITRLKEVKKVYIGEYDESDQYIYTNDRHFIPNFVRKLLGWKLIHQDRRVRRFGRIKAHLFYYVTTPMLIVTGALMYVVTQSFSTLLVFFETNIYLNGLIVSFMIFAILRVYYNSFLIFRASSFLRMLEKTTLKENVTPRDVENLRIALENRGELFNTYSMAEVLDNYEKFNFFNITDNQARFIKSKLGYRINNNRKGVNFIGGVLVMLGLLGTFLGLLSTIDAVGEALDGMSNLGGEGEVGMEEMSGFIGSLAAPLQGMGLAFSSSLFGLTGSLLIGFYLHLAATPQNYFVENVSRWIDDRVQKFDPKKLAAKAKEADNKEGKDRASEKPAQQVKATDHDLKDWLTGYVYLTTQTNKKLENIAESISYVGQGIKGASDELKVISGNQGELLKASQVLDNTLNCLVSQTQKITVSMGDVQNLSHTMNSAMTSIDITNKAIAEAVPAINSSLEVMDQNNSKYAGAVYNEIKEANASNSTVLESISQQTPKLASIEKSIGVMNEQTLEIARHDITKSKDMQDTLKNVESLLINIEKLNKDSSEQQANQKTLQNIESLLTGVQRSNNELARAINAMNKKSGTYSNDTRFSFFPRRKNKDVNDLDEGEL